MKLMSYNIFEGGEGRIDPLAEVIRLFDPDVLILIEPWNESLFHKLADKLNMDRFLADSPTNPHGSTGLLSRYKIKEAVNHAPLDPRLTRSAFHAIIKLPSNGLEAWGSRPGLEGLMNGNRPDATSPSLKPAREGTSPKPVELPIIGLHLHARETLADEQIRLTELPALFDIAEQFRGRPHLLAGDFNSCHPQQIIDLSKLRPKTRARLAAQNNRIPREVVRTILEHGYVDAHTLHHAPEHFDTSFTTSHPAARVDYLFLTPDLAPHVTSCEIFKPEMAKYASDHFPLIAEIDI